MRSLFGCNDIYTGDIKSILTSSLTVGETALNTHGKLELSEQVIKTKDKQARSHISLLFILLITLIVDCAR